MFAFCLLPFAFCLCLPVVAGAQTARNPFADLFGRAPTEDRAEVTVVNLRTTAGAQIGQTLRADLERQDAVPEGLAAGADAMLTARYLRDRVDAQAHGRYSYQEFRATPAFGAPAFDANGRIKFDATTRLSLYGGGQFMRSPFYRLMWLAPEMFGPSVATGPGSAILMKTNDTAEGNVGAIAELGRRTTLDVMGFARQTRFEDAPLSDFASSGGRAVLRQRLNRSLTLRGGYLREEFNGGAGTPADRFVNEIIDVGVDFAKSFSMGRRSSLAFNTETSMVRHLGEREFRLNGMVAFERRFLRTWITQLSGRRGTEFLPGFRAPVFTDRGGAALAGYMTKRLLFEAHADGGRGAVGMVDARKFMSYAADAALTFGVTRNVAVFTQYYFYHYQMPPDPLALATAQHLSRQTVSIGVKTFISIIDKEKVPRDPR